MEPREPDFEKRRGKATASKFYAVMSGKTTTGRQEYIAELAWERITGKTHETYKSKDMERGNLLEPLARLRYSLKTKNVVEDADFVEHELLAAGATPDGLIGSDGVLEIKCPKWHNHITALKKQQVPSIYKWQVQGQLLMTGRKWADFVSFTDEVDGDASLAIVRVERNESMITELEQGIADFLDEVDELEKFLQDYGKDNHAL